MKLDLRCKGCLSFEVVDNSPIASCAVLYERDGMICPCIDCVIKMVCETPCEDFDNWDIYLNGGDGKYQGVSNGQ